MRHVAAFILPGALALAGCYGSITFHGDAGDAGGDPGHDPDLDTTHDPDTDPSADPVPDFHHDTYDDDRPDPGDGGVPDGVPCWSATADAGGVCSVIDQCGCPPGEWCTWNITGDCQLIEECYGGAAGTFDVGTECSGDVSECRPGTDCMPYGSTNLCYEWCVDDDDCSLPGTVCNTPVSFSLPSPCSEVVTAPYMLCSTVCPPDSGCDPLTGGTCGTGNACYWGSECDNLVCGSAGTGLPGDRCVDTGCADGSWCYSTTYDPEVRCYQFCDVSATDPACSIGTCNAVGSTSHPDLGVCMTP